MVAETKKAKVDETKAPAHAQAGAAATKVEAKPQEKKEVKADAKTEVKKVVEKKKFIQYVKKKNEKKSAEAKAVQKRLAESKKGHPTFRGRFGKMSIRKIKKDKWNKWRKPHGIDLDKGLQHGFRPKIGYRNDAELRHMHPSGYKEVLVNNMLELSKINPATEAIRIGSTVGKRKRNEIVTKANEKKIWILN